MKESEDAKREWSVDVDLIYSGKNEIERENVKTYVWKQEPKMYQLPAWRQQWQRQIQGYLYEPPICASPNDEEWVGQRCCVREPERQQRG